MAQEHQEENLVDPATQSVKRKRGRPRKVDTAGSEPSNRSRRRRVDTETYGNDPFVGQVVSGVLDGKFDAGYMLTVRLGDRGSVLRGVVFEPGLSVPVSAANDIAPNVKMFKRDEISLPPPHQPLCFSPIQPGKDGATRYQQGNESAMLPKGSCQDISPGDPDAKEQMNISPNIVGLLENGNHALGNWNQDVRSTIAVHAFGEVRNVKSVNVVSENPSNIHVIRPDSTTATAHFQEGAGEDKQVSQLAPTIPDAKQVVTSDVGNVEEGVVMLNTQTDEVTDESNKTGVTSSSFHEDLGDTKPATQVSTVKIHEPKLSLDISDPGLNSIGSETTSHVSDAIPATDKSSDVEPVVTSNTFHGDVGCTKPVTEVSLVKIYEPKLSIDKSEPRCSSIGSETPGHVNDAKPSTDKSGDIEPVSGAQTLDSHGKALVFSKQATDTKASIPAHADETIDSGSIPKNATSVAHHKELPSVSVRTAEQTNELTFSTEPIVQILENEQSAEAFYSGPTFTGETTDDHDKVQYPETAGSSNVVPGKADDLHHAPHATESSVDESGMPQCAKAGMGTGILEVIEEAKSSSGQISQAHLASLGSEPNMPIELLRMSSLVLEDSPDQLTVDPVAPTPENTPSGMLSAATATEASTNSSQGDDTNEAS